MARLAMLLAALLVAQAALAGCIGSEDAPAGPDAADEAEDPEANDTSQRFAEPNRTGPEPPEGEDYTGLLPIEMIFDGSLRTPETKVGLIPPQHGDLTQPTNTSRSTLAYLEATLEGLFAWEPAIDAFTDQYPSYSHLDNVTVDVELFEEEVHDTVGYDIVIGYAETSGGAFRGVAVKGPANEDQQIQQTINEAGLGDTVHMGHRYILLSLFASAPRAGQDTPDYPERHEVRGVTMHEFAHVWGLGHSSTWTKPYGPDLMNSPYPFVYGDGDPTGDGGERSPELCITSLNLHGLGHLYRWLPNGTWEATHQNVTLPEDVTYERYCEVHEEARERARAWMAERGLVDGALVEAST